MPTEANSINAATTGLVINTGTAFTATTVTQHDLLVGGASNAITSVAPSATSGVPVISQGASADPTFGTAVVAGGGTGVASFTAFAPIVGGTTSTGALQSATTGLSTSGLPLLSGGASALPTYAALSASNVNGTTSGSAPGAGVIGQRIESVVASGSVTMATTTVTNMTSISLTAGCWDVSLLCMLQAGGATTVFRASISTTSATEGTSGNNMTSVPIGGTFSGNQDYGIVVPAYRLNLGSTTTVYAVALAVFGGGGTLSTYGRLSATRVG